MRISETKVVQLIDSDPPQLVILDEVCGQEIAFTAKEADKLYAAIAYFHPYLHGMFKESPASRLTALLNTSRYNPA